MRTPQGRTLLMLALCLPAFAGCMGPTDEEPDLPLHTMRLQASDLTDDQQSLEVTLEVLRDTPLSFEWGNGRPADVPSEAWRSCGRTRWTLALPDGPALSSRERGDTWVESVGEGASVSSAAMKAPLPGTPLAFGNAVALTQEVGVIPAGTTVALLMAAQGGDRSVHQGYVGVRAGHEDALRVVDRARTDFACGVGMRGFDGMHATTGDAPYGRAVAQDSRMRLRTDVGTHVEWYAVPTGGRVSDLPNRCHLSVSLSGEPLGVAQAAGPGLQGACAIEARGGPGEVELHLRELDQAAPVIAHLVWDAPVRGSS